MTMSDTGETGKICQRSGYYKFSGHTDGSIGCHETLDESDITLSKGDIFPPVKHCRKNAYWNLWIHQSRLDGLIDRLPKESPTIIKKFFIDFDTKSQLPKNSEDFSLGFTLGYIITNFVVDTGMGYNKWRGKEFTEEDYNKVIQTVLKKLDEIRDTILKNKI